MSILGLTWPWRKKKGRTFESFDKKGRRRVLCVAGGSPVTGEVADRWNRYSDEWIRYALCSECGLDVRVTGPKPRPRLFVHNGKGH